MAHTVEQIISANFSASTDHSTSFDTTPASNNALAYFLQIDKSAGSFGTVPSGWTYSGTNVVGSSVSRACATKKSAGNEASVNITTSNSRQGNAVLMEISGLDTTTPIDADANDENDSGESTVGSLACGTIASANRDQDEQYVIAMAGLDSNNWIAPMSYTNSFLSLIDVRGGTSGAIHMCFKDVNASGDVLTTISGSSNVDQAAGNILAFNIAVVGGGLSIPVAMHSYRQHHQSVV